MTDDTKFNAVNPRNIGKDRLPEKEHSQGLSKAMSALLTPARSTLSFDTLRRANTMRLPLFKNRRGEPAHSQPDGSDWSNPEWCNAVLGELGELANLLKKVRRGDYSPLEMESHINKAIADELADVVTYLDILAFRCGVNLGQATMDKFNEVSRRVGCAVRIHNNVVVHDVE
jgi:NTP pyrophosphatase (non-canonical NTP hydrolase)